MKKISMFRLIGSLTIAIFIATSCNKDDSNKVNVKDYIEVENGDFLSQSLPDENSTTYMAGISANNRALEGGSTPITITPASVVTHVLIGIDGVPGHYKVAMADLEATSTGYIAIILFENNLPKDEFTLVTEMLNENDNIIGSRTNIVVSTLEQSSSAKMQISLSWDLLNDIDLHVIDPSGNEIYYGNPGYISYDWVKIQAEHPDDYYTLTESELAEYIVDNPEITGVLDLDSNPGCSIDSVNNENIIYIFPTDITTGEYIVRVDFYSDCLGFGTTNFIVTARYDNKIIEPTSGNNPSYSSFVSGTDYFDDYGSGVEVMRFNISEVKSAGDVQHIYLQKPAQQKINTQKAIQKLAGRK